MKKIIFVLTIVLAICLNSYAKEPINTDKDLLSKGTVAFNQKDYKTALVIFSNLAQKNNPRAQGFLGIMYAYGYGIEKNSQEAIKWLEKSANQGYSDSLNILAAMYLDGKGIPQDSKKAIELYQKSAKAGNDKALLQLGLIYSEGKGVEKNNNIAYKYLIRSENYGNIQAKNILKTFCENNPTVCK